MKEVQGYYVFHAGSFDLNKVLKCLTSRHGNVVLEDFLDGKDPNQVWDIRYMRTASGWLVHDPSCLSVTMSNRITDRKNWTLYPTGTDVFKRYIISPDCQKGLRSTTGSHNVGLERRNFDSLISMAWYVVETDTYDQKLSNLRPDI